jgi:hypothetical protein
MNTTKAELLEALQVLKDIMQYCVTPKGVPDKGKGRTPEQQVAMDKAFAVLRSKN